MEDRTQEIQGEINALLNLLKDTDYKAIKHSEGQITDQEYAETKAQRQEWRDKINELEEELDSLSEGRRDLLTGMSCR